MKAKGAKTYLGWSTIAYSNTAGKATLSFHTQWNSQSNPTAQSAVDQVNPKCDPKTGACLTLLGDGSLKAPKCLGFPTCEQINPANLIYNVVSNSAFGDCTAGFVSIKNASMTDTAYVYRAFKSYDPLAYWWVFPAVVLPIAVLATMKSSEKSESFTRKDF